MASQRRILIVLLLDAAKSIMASCIIATLVAMLRYVVP